MWGRQKRLVGLDIGASGVKMIELKRTKSGFHLVNFGMKSLPPEAIVDGSIMNGPLVVSEISDLAATLGLGGREVALGVSGHSVIIKKVDLSTRTEKELAETIVFDSEQYIPFDINDVDLDFQILPDSKEQGMMSVLLVAAKKEMTGDRVGVATEAGLVPVIVDIDTFAVENAFEACYGVLPSTVMLLNVGASSLNINILTGGITAFTRDISAGGHAVTEAIQKEFGVSYEEAETLKLGGQGADDATAILPERVDRIVEEVCAGLATDVHRTLEFFHVSTTSSRVERIYLSGGSSKIPALSRAVEAKVGIPVEVMDPLRAVHIDERKFDAAYLRDVSAQLAVCVGLALRSPGDKPQMH